MKEDGHSASDSALAAIVTTQLGSDIYRSADTAFSPFFSNVGLTFDGTLGVCDCVLYHNRHAVGVNTPLLAILRGGKPLVATETETAMMGIVQKARLGQGGSVTCETVFSGFNTWLSQIEFGDTETTEDLTIGIFPFGPQAKESGIQHDRRQGIIVASMKLPTMDQRDTDRDFEILFRLRYRLEDWREIRVEETVSPGRPSVLLLPASEAGRTFTATLCFQAEVAGMRTGELDATPLEIEPAREKTRKWWTENLRLPCDTDADPTFDLYVKAGISLLQNACRAGGRLRHGVASFPSRGTYPCHYFWDSVFQNLGLIHINPGLARDALLLLIENIEPDGKVPHFICTTWNRPGSSQSPLLGWGVWNYFQATGDRELAQRALPALERNTEWWFSARDPRGAGLAECADPLEIWDDTPRLDIGAIHPVDVNAYLAIQMKVCASLAELNGDSANARQWRKRYQSHLERLHDRLYCPRDNLYYDRLVERDELLRLKTPAGFMPLLLEDLPLPMERRREMIRQYLLSPRYFYGAVPFPVVAYDEPSYRPGGWWRGPMWPPIACLMLEILQRNGFEAEHWAAAEKLHALLLADGQLHELFNSETGAGLGAPEQGWTAGIYIHLWHLINDRPTRIGKQHIAATLHTTEEHR